MEEQKYVTEIYFTEWVLSTLFAQGTPQIQMQLCSHIFLTTFKYKSRCILASKVEEWGRYIPLKILLTSIGQRHIISHKIHFFIVTPVRTLKLILLPFSINTFCCNFILLFRVDFSRELGQKPNIRH
jgi:hypothetical protein